MCVSASDLPEILPAHALTCRTYYCQSVSQTHSHQQRERERRSRLCSLLLLVESLVNQFSFVVVLRSHRGGAIAEPGRSSCDVVTCDRVAVFVFVLFVRHQYHCRSAPVSLLPKSEAVLVVAGL